MLLKYYLPSFALWTMCCDAVVVPKGAPCEALQFTYRINSTVANVPPRPDLSTNEDINRYLPLLSQQLNTAPNITREGNYTLAGWYCKAPDQHNKGAPLQVLAHGASYTKEYWNRAAWGNMTIKNSWQQFALESGYSTLAIDRLCYGESSHLDPVLDCQLTTGIEIFHALFADLKKGTASPKIPIPSELAFVGHSAGSIAVSNFVQAYPDDVDTAILTGWPSATIARAGAAEYYESRNMTQPPGPTGQSGFLPGAIAFSNRFAGLDQGYIASTSLNSRAIGYEGKYDPSYPPLDYMTQSTLPLGETSYTGLLSFPAFKGRIVIATGEFDYFAFADPDVIERTRGRFPFARSYHWVNGTQSGHLVNYHKSAHRTYQKVFTLLGRKGSRTTPPDPKHPNFLKSV
ncbi:MAG: hypothetical protein Q9168_003230 [Polycauliona sp. 1 TL-2023]